MPDVGPAPRQLVRELRRRLAVRTAIDIATAQHTRAAVIVPLLFKDDVPHVLFTERSHDVATHKGQISFPGGVVEDHDADLSATALRETEEEVGILPDQVDILGRLDDLLTNTSGFVITPFVGVVPDGVAYRTSDLEVARILEIPLGFLLDSRNRQADSRTDHWQYAWKDVIVWGATARILTGFLSILKDPLAEHSLN